VATVPVPAGTHTLAITPGIETPEEVATSLDLTVEGKGSKRTLTALLTDDVSAPIAGQTIVFTANGAEIGTATTNESGLATLTAPAGYRGGDITFTAIYGGNALYAASSDSETV
jgi:hypothetical protein